MLSLLEERTGARRSRREAPLVGRRDEFVALQTLFARVARNDAPHLVDGFRVKPAWARRALLAASSIRSRCNDPPRACAGAGAFAFGSSIVYRPLGAMLRTECAIVDGDPAEVAVGEALRAG